MPKSQTRNEKERELEREVRPHHRKLKGLIKIDQDGFGDDGWRAYAGIKPDQWSPPSVADEFLLQQTPSRTHVPAEPRLLDAVELPLPLFGGGENGFEREGVGLPVTGS